MCIRDRPATIQAANNPEDPAAGAREIPFEPELFIEREDFAEVPPPKYFRLAPGKSVRLRNAGFVTCTGFEKDAAGNITLIRGRFTPMNQPVKVKATIHWVPAQAARPVEVRLYDQMCIRDSRCPGPRPLRPVWVGGFRPWQRARRFWREPH